MKDSCNLIPSKEIVLFLFFCMFGIPFLTIINNVVSILEDVVVPVVLYFKLIFGFWTFFINVSYIGFYPNHKCNTTLDISYSLSVVSSF